jgi:hypothetical protein
MRFPQKKLISSSSGSLQSLDDLDIFPDLGPYVFGKFQKKLTVTSLLHENVTRAQLRMVKRFRGDYHHSV